MEFSESLVTWKFAPSHPNSPKIGVLKVGDVSPAAFSKYMEHSDGLQPRGTVQLD